MKNTYQPESIDKMVSSRLKAGTELDSPLSWTPVLLLVQVSPFGRTPGPLIGPNSPFSWTPLTSLAFLFRSAGWTSSQCLGPDSPLSWTPDPLLGVDSSGGWTPWTLCVGQGARTPPNSTAGPSKDIFIVIVFKIIFL